MEDLLGETKQEGVTVVESGGLNCGPECGGGRDEGGEEMVDISEVEVN